MQKGKYDELGFRIEVLKDPDGKPNVLVENVVVSWLMPAANAKLAAIRWRTFKNAGELTDEIAVVNQEGQVLTRIKQ